MNTPIILRNLKERNNKKLKKEIENYIFCGDSYGNNILGPPGCASC